VICFATGSDSWSSAIAELDQDIAEQSGNTRPIEWAIPLAQEGITLAQVAAGDGDSAYQTMADKVLAARSSGTIYIRLGWEMNIPGLWAWDANGDAANYIAAFRHVVGVWRAKSSRFSIVWCPSWSIRIAGVPQDPSPFYPGDAYVDVIGMDVYFITEFDQDAGQTGAEVFAYKKTTAYGLDWLAAFGVTHGKPIALPEWGLDADEPDYVALMHEWVLDNDLKYHGFWDRNAEYRNKLSDGQHPNAGAKFIELFGPMTVTSSFSRYGSKAAVTALALSTSKTRVTWSIPAATTGMSISGSALFPDPSLPLGVHTVTVRATDERGLYADQEMSVDMKATLADWTPAQLGTSVIAWFDATDAAAVAFSSASPWASKVEASPGEGVKTLFNDTVGLRPSYQATGRNSRPSVRFLKASNHRLLLSSMTGMPQGSEAHTAVIQAYLDPASIPFEEIGTWGSGTSNRRAFSTNGDLKVAVQAGSFHSPQLDLWSALDRAIVWTLGPDATPGEGASPYRSNIYVDGGTAASAVTTTPTTPNVDGSFPNPNGNIGLDAQEWLVANRVVTADERRNVEGYLAWKWNRVASLPSDHPYKLAKPLLTEA